MGGDNHVDAVHRLRQPLILGPVRFLVGAGVGQAEDDLRPLGLQGLHAPLRRLGGVLQSKAGGGRVIVGLLPHEAEDAEGDAAPLQHQRLLYAVAVHGGLDIRPVRIVRRRGVIGLQQGGQAEGRGTVRLLVICPGLGAEHGCQGGIPGVRRRVQHGGKPRPAVIELVVSNGNGVIAQGPHGPQLRGLGGEERLDEGADGKVPAVHQQGVRVHLPLPVDGGFQPGVTAALPARPVGPGAESGSGDHG